jgi:hypothetical protein
MKALLFIGGDAPTRDAELTVRATDSPFAYDAFEAFYAPGFDACTDPDCKCRSIIRGFGATPEAAIADYWETWLERHPEESAT